MNSDEVRPSVSPVAKASGKGRTKEKRPRLAESQFRLSRKTLRTIERHVNAAIESAAHRIAIKDPAENPTQQPQNHPEKNPILILLRIILDLLMEHKIKVILLALGALVAKFFDKISHVDLTALMSGATGFAIAYGLVKYRRG